TAIWASTSVLPELRAELGAAPARRLDRARQALGEPLLGKDLERRLGGAAPGGHVLSQRLRGLGAFERQLRRAVDHVLGELQGVVPRDAQALGAGGELLDEP